ncbi:MAG: type II toxin-antitoxin system RelE/ParE family toxin [Bdellovibrionales bacterium]
MTKLGSKPFSIEYLETVVDEDIPALPKTIRARVRKAIETRLTADPVGLGRPLRYSFIGHRRIRVGDYRIVYRIDIDRNAVVVVLIKHRKHVYEE